MYLTVKNAAEILQVSTKTIFRRIADGSIPAFKMGARAIRIHPDDLKAYAEGSPAKTKTEVKQ